MSRPRRANSNSNASENGGGDESGTQPKRRSSSGAAAAAAAAGGGGGGGRSKRKAIAEPKEDEEQPGAAAAADPNDDDSADAGADSKRRSRAAAPAASVAAAGGSGASPKRVKRRGGVAAADNSVFDDGKGESLLSQTTSPAFAELSNEDIKKMVDETVRYFLLANIKKIPVKAAEITKHVTALHTKGKVTKDVIAEAARRLKSVFGYELFALPPRIEHKKIDSNAKKLSKAAAAAAATGSGILVPGAGYILRNAIESEHALEHLNSITTGAAGAAGSEAERGLILVLLSFIFLHNEDVAEAKLWRWLERCGLPRKMKAHPVFGSVETFVQTTLTKQTYLERRKDESEAAASIESSQSAAARASYSYRLGARGLAEIGRRNIYHFASDIINQPAAPVFLAEIESHEKKLAAELAAAKPDAASAAADGSGRVARSGSGAARGKRGRSAAAAAAEDE